MEFKLETSTSKRVKSLMPERSTTLSLFFRIQRIFAIVKFLPLFWISKDFFSSCNVNKFLFCFLLFFPVITYPDATQQPISYMLLLFLFWKRSYKDHMKRRLVQHKRLMNIVLKEGMYFLLSKHPIFECF